MNQTERVFNRLYYSWGSNIWALRRQLWDIPAPSVRRALYELVKQGRAKRTKDGYRRV